MIWRRRQVNRCRWWERCSSGGGEDVLSSRSDGVETRRRAQVTWRKQGEKAGRGGETAVKKTYPPCLLEPTSQRQGPHRRPGLPDIHTHKYKYIYRGYSLPVERQKGIFLYMCAADDSKVQHSFASAFIRMIHNHHLSFMVQHSSPCQNWML